MKKGKIISLSISLFLFIIGIIAIIQIYPYTNLKNCQITTNLTLNGTSITVKNNGNSMAKFPDLYFSLYRNDIYVGDAYIKEFEIKPKEEVSKKIDMKLKISVNDTIKLIKTNETKINGTIRIPFLAWKISIPFKMIRIDNGKTTVYVWGRKIER